MKNIKLSITERLGIIRLFNQIYAMNGLDIMGLKRSAELGEKCELSLEEKTKIKWVDLSNGAANIDLNIAKTIEIEVNMSDEEISLFKRAVDMKQKIKSFGNHDVFILGLYEKLGISLDAYLGENKE